MESNRRRSARRWLFLAAKLGLLAAVAWGVHHSVEHAVTELGEHHWRPTDLRPGWLLAAGLVYLLSQLPAGVFWHQVMHALGQRPSFGASMRAYFIGHLGKYVPGKALVVLLRAGLVRGPATDVGVAAACVFIETLTMMAVGAFVGGALLAVWMRHQTWLLVLALGMMVGAGLPTLPPVFRRLVRLVGVRKRLPMVAARIDELRYSTLLTGWLTMTVGWLLNGLSLWGVVLATGLAEWPGTFDQFVACQAATPLAVVAGFVSFVPGGAGVREAVLMALLAPVFDDATALVAAIVARLLWLVAEVVISGILYISGLGPPRPPDSLPTSTPHPDLTAERR